MQPVWHRQLKRIVYIDEPMNEPTQLDVMQAISAQIARSQFSAQSVKMHISDFNSSDIDQSKFEVLVEGTCVTISKKQVQ